MTSASLRTRLFLILVAATSMIWLFAIGWIYVGTKQEVESVLDARLQEAARMVASLGTSKSVATPSAETGMDSPAGTLIYDCACSSATVSACASTSSPTSSRGCWHRRS